MSYRSPQELIEAFRDWHVPIRAYEPDGAPWQSHTTAGGWDAHAVLHHHTAGSRRLLSSRLSVRAMLRILRNGYSGLPGPLCHFAPAMDSDGRAVLWLVGWGNVNHAGLGDPVNYSQLVAGTYNGRAPRSSTVDGNRGIYGLEYMHPGDGTPWPDELLDVGHRAAAAICDAHSWGASSNLDHREWTTRKIDRSWHGDARAAVARVMAEGPDGGGSMSWAEQITNYKGQGGKTRRAQDWLLRTYNTSHRGDLQSREARNRLRRMEPQLADVQAQLAELREELPELVEHAAAAGARKALADSTVQVDVNVNGKVDA